MKRIASLFSIFFILAIGLACGEEKMESSPTNNEKGILEDLSESLERAAKEVLEEKVEEFKKGIQGKVTSVKVIKEEPEHLILEVSFKKVRKPEEIYITGEVLRGGVPATDFVVDRVPLSKKQGTIQLNVYYVESETTDRPPVKTDQIKIYFYPAGEPDNHFGEYYLALVRDWGASSGKKGSGEEEAITLVEEEPATQKGPENLEEVSPPLIKPPLAQNPQISPAKALPPLRKPSKKPFIFVTQYDFFANAHKAKWRSRYGELPFPGKDNDHRGFVRPISNAYLSTGNQAIKLLETHPAWEARGWISGEYPSLLLGKGVHFKAVVGFLKGAKASDGAIFKVYVKDNKNHKKIRVFARYLPCDRYTHVDVDLSRYAGKRITLILYVNAWHTSAQDWAVWVAPRLTTK